ncbi:MAG: chromate transporter [Legionella sp.]|nr:MAG: chromate transporter [Legionella sp.]
MINTLLSIIFSFGKIGIISLGGGNSMLKLLEYEAVTYRHWVGQEEFISMLGTSFLFPGLTGVKLAALIGYKAAGFAGLVLAVLSLNLPGLIMAAAGYHWLTTHDGPTTKKVMIGVQYGALALLAAATYSVAQGVVGIYVSYPIAIISLVFFIALAFLNVSPFWGFLVFIGLCFFLVR